jgi:hypothetical protein
MFPRQIVYLCRPAAAGVPQSAPDGRRIAMTTATLEEAVKEASYEAGRAAHRAVVEGRHAVEDLRDTTIVRVRKHPLESLGWTFAAGALVGCMVGYALGHPCASKK